MSAIEAVSSALAAFRRQVERVDRVAERVARDAPDGDLASEMVDLRRAEHGAAAAAQVLRTADEMVGTLLDVLA